MVDLVVKNRRILIFVVNEKSDFVCVTVYRIAFIHVKEVGTIRVNIFKDYSQIEFFRVKESYRAYGIGRMLMTRIENLLKKRECSLLIVYPHSEAYEEETLMQPEVLYMIYEHLGFRLEDSSADRKRLIRKMYKEVD